GLPYRTGMGQSCFEGAAPETSSSATVSYNGGHPEALGTTYRMDCRPTVLTTCTHSNSPLRSPRRAQLTIPPSFDWPGSFGLGNTGRFSHA
ncbi:MAG TPA: hypothetical protein VI386_37145, partial [Candidatus Sulfotelmatobacter sp.]